MSSRQMGTWPQLIHCALFKIWSLILDGEPQCYVSVRHKAYHIIQKNLVFLLRLSLDKVIVEPFLACTRMQQCIGIQVNLN